MESWRFLALLNSTCADCTETETNPDDRNDHGCDGTAIVGVYVVLTLVRS